MNESRRTFTPSEKRTVLAIFAQHWENARHIKNERLSFTSIYALLSAGILSLLHAVRSDEAVLHFSLLLFLIALSIIGLLTTLRLKAELEECLRNIQQIVAQLGLEEFMPVVDSHGALTRYPKFRWVFPIFYSICTAGLTALLIYRWIGNGMP